MIPNENETLSNVTYPWLTVKNDLELKIISGEYKAGERIPPVRKIAELYGIGSSTAAKTLAQMHKEGTIYQRRGVGYFVRPFVRETLIAEHRHNLEKTLINAFEYADLLGIDMSTIINRILNTRDRLRE